MKDRLIQIVQEAGGCACRKPWRYSVGMFCKKTPGQRAYGGLRKRSTVSLRRRRFYAEKRSSRGGTPEKKIYVFLTKAHQMTVT